MTPTAPRVFIVNEPLGSGGKRVIDLSPALEFGQMVHVLPAGQVVNDPDTLTNALRAGLADFREGDYLLLVGNPAAIGCATALAASLTGGSVNLLRWHGHQRRYEAMSVDLAVDDTDEEVQGAVAA